MESVGARLKKLRLEKGVSLEEVNKQTKIHLEVLKSLEEDSVANLNPVYLKGFIKSYCQLLGADPADYLHAASQPQRLPEAPRIQERGAPGPLAGSATPVKFKIIALCAGIVGIILVAAGLFNLVRFSVAKVSAGLKKHREHAVVEKVKAAKKAKAPALPKTAGAAVSGVPKSPARTAASSQGAVFISIQAIDDCWVQVRSDSKTVFQNIIKRGRSESWSAKEKIELTLGSAGSVRLEVNGRLMAPGSLGRKGLVLRNILITKDGLNPDKVSK